MLLKRAGHIDAHFRRLFWDWKMYTWWYICLDIPPINSKQSKAAHFNLCFINTCVSWLHHGKTYGHKPASWDKSLKPAALSLIHSYLSRFAPSTWKRHMDSIVVRSWHMWSGDQTHAIPLGFTIGLFSQGTFWGVLVPQGWRSLLKMSSEHVVVESDVKETNEKRCPPDVSPARLNAQRFD